MNVAFTHGYLLKSETCLLCQTPMTVKHILLDCTIFYVNAQHFYSEICSTDAFKKNKSKFMLRVFVLY